MLSFNLENLRAIDSKHGVSMNDLKSKGDQIPDYLKSIETRDQGFYSVIDDDAMVEKIQSFADSVQGEFKDIVVLAVGGSSLGTICLQQSLKHLFENERVERDAPRLHVIDNIDPSLISEIEDVIDYAHTLFIVVTKSGGTPETLAQYFYFEKRCFDQGHTPSEHFVFVTDPERGLLRKVAKEGGVLADFEVPPNVGGRFSVLTPVGLLPAALIGIDIKKLLKGARDMRDLFLSESFEKNLPFQLATIQYLLGKKDKSMTVLMPYAQKLIRFADWYRQLLAESIGKAKNEKGETVNVGITPINALGITDQHSQSQLYNEGPNDKLIIFIGVDKMKHDILIPNPYPDDPTVSFLNGVTFEKLIKTEMKGTMQALTQNDRPNVLIQIPQIDEETLGQLFLLFEGSIAFLGEFYDINAFDQPGVELSKTLTKKLLSS
ncbi:MAG: glucose-6-phosphate isomerase [Candidatus Peregrinibacteria bacterium]|nr:glucose-6-phosphate isomerase [Candidatus Peregrinibacteria bacterium]